MKRIIKVLPIIAILASTIVTQPVWADDSVNLEARLNDLEQQVAILKRQIENSKEDTATQAVSTPVVTANSKDGFSGSIRKVKLCLCSCLLGASKWH